MPCQKTEYLVEWIITFEKHKDIMKKEITNITKQKENEIHIEKKSGDIICIVSPDLNNNKEIIDLLKTHDKLTLVCLNTKKNIEYVTEHWNSFINNANYKIFFVNPFSLEDKFFILAPCVHNKICDTKKLLQGLTSMAENVGFTTEEDFRTNIERNKYKQYDKT